MELSIELIEQLEKTYYEWLDDYELFDLPKDTSPKGVFNFIKQYISTNTEEDL